MRETMDLQAWRQRRGEMRREVERNRLERASRGSPRRSGPVRASSLARKADRLAGPLRKLLRPPAPQETGSGRPPDGPRGPSQAWSRGTSVPVETKRRRPSRVGGRGEEALVQMAWLFLIAAGLVEVAFALSIGPTEGFTRLPQTALCFVLGAGSIYLLTYALETLPIGAAYAAFTGIGAVGTVVLGIVLAGDPATPGRLVPIALIMAGIVALRLFSTA